jgi:hypothetical protein
MGHHGIVVTAVIDDTEARGIQAGIDS